MTDNCWKRDEGYSWCKTLRVDHLALVLCDPDFYCVRRGWGFQVFDEDDPDCIESGEFIYTLEGIWSEAAAMRIAEMFADDYLSY